MADPGTWALIIAGTSAAVGVAGSLSKGQATASADRYQAQVARNNAQIAEQNAQYATVAGHEKSQDVAMRGRGQIGAIKVAQAASGLDVNSGSAPMVRAGAAGNVTQDVLRTEHAAALEAYGYRTQKTSDQAQAGLLENEASGAKHAAAIDAAGGLLGFASQVSGKWGSTSGAGPGGSSIYDTPGVYGNGFDSEAGNFQAP